MRGKLVRVLVAGALVAALGACGDDDDTEDAGSATTTTVAGGGSSENELSVEMVDYGYKVDGAVKGGLVTISSRNTGAEWHMAGFGKLKAGATVEQLTTALQAAGEGGDQEEDPTAAFIEEELGSPGHILQPGSSQSLTVDLTPGNYVMLCFLPTEGEGTPHFAKGMVGSFTVEAGDAGAEEPQAEATVTLADEAEPVGVPTELEAGEHTFAVTSTGSNGKDFIIGQLDDDKPFDAFDEYFSTLFEQEGGPPKGAAAQAPGRIHASTFEIEPGQTIYVTVELEPGKTFFVGTTNVESDGEEESIDKFVEVTVT